MREKRTRPAVPILTADGDTPRTEPGVSADTPSAPAASSPAASAVDPAAKVQKRRTMIAELALFRDMTAETVEQMPLGFVALDHAMCATYANPMALTLTGASLDALVGRRPWDLFPEIVGTQRQTVRTSAPTSIEYETQFAPTDRWAAVLSCPTQTGISIFLRDISGQKRAEETVRSSVELLHGSLDSMLDAAMVCSAERDDQDVIVSFRVDFANVVAGTYLGGLPDKLMGAAIPDWRINPRDMPFLDACRRVVETGDPLSVDALAYMIAGPDGASMPGELSLQVARFSDGFFATWRDVTETQRLASERERLATIVDQAADGIVTVDAELRITYANVAFADDLGRTPTDLVGRSILEVAAGTLDPTTIANLVEVARAGQPWLGEAERRLIDGRAGPVQIRGTPRRAADGTLEGYVIVSRDVTELREAERAARENEGRYRSIVDGAAEGIYRTSREGRIVAANPALATILGYDSEDAVINEVVDVGRQLWANPDDRLRILGLLDEQGVVHAYECQLVRRDGTPIWVSQHVSVVRGPDGQAAYYDGFVEDITDRKGAEEALRKREREMRRLSTAIEQSADSVVITDTTGAIEYVNPAFERVSGYSRDEVVGQNPRILKSGVQGPAFYAAMWDALTSGQSFVSDITNRRKDGRLYQEESVVSPILDEAGTIVSYVAVKRDVTRERASEAARESLARERALIAGALADLHVLPSPAATASEIARHVVRLAGITTARLAYFTLVDPAIPLAFVRADGVGAQLARVPLARGRLLRERAAEGPWVEAWVGHPTHPYDRLFRELGIVATAHAPIRHRGELIGLLSVSSSEAKALEQLTETLPALLEFAGVAGALLGPAIVGLTESGEVRVRIARVIGEGAFVPVFQPIVDIPSGDRVGFEALTRFSSGVRPDLVFADARAVSLEAELEMATLAASIKAAAGLPLGAWLSLNVSPSLVTGNAGLARLLQKADRPIVLEVTEHVSVADYGGLRAAIGMLNPEVRVAVDDAGSGIANFGHIVELRPAFVKLDIGLVRGIDSDLTRQALMVGLLHFARSSSSQTIAEGVETDLELATLRALGVPLAQGYLLGRPAPAAEWADGSIAIGSGRSEPTTRQS